MNSQLTATIVGKIRTPVETTERNGKTVNKFSVTSRLRSYCRNEGKAIWSPMMYFVTVFGTLRDKLKDYLSQEGNSVVIMNGEVEVSVA